MTATPPKPHDELSLVAARLSRAAPNTWEEFLKAMHEYSRLKSADVVTASSDKIFLAQGRAQQCVELLELFEKAIIRANALNK